MSWTDICPAEGSDGTLREARAGGILLGVANTAGAWRVFDAYCTHAECPLTDGWLEGSSVRCACHGALFDLETGTVLDGPAEQPIRLYETRVTGGRVEALLDDAHE
ncbi:MAG TPA: Rieske (2Fe-2S) protein [Gaiellaceae bacterium]|nr:Rieske (2Fe-2S) protein [Gaiellaceae bacterium]